MKRVVAFVLGYRAAQDLRAGTLGEIVDAAARIPGCESWVMYVDNYSRDGSVQYICERHPEVELLLGRSNLNYCGGVNAGLQYAHRRWAPDHMILIDADNPCRPDAYEELVRFADENPRSGMVQPLVRSRSSEDVIYSCGHRFLDDGQCRPLTELPEDRRALLRLPSCSISSTLVRATALERVGILDPVFEMYFESSDLSFRMRRAGYDCSCHPEAVTYNEGSAGQGIDRVHQRYYFNRNRLLFWRLHDEERFAHVRRIQLGIYRELQARFEESELGLDPESEPVRKGIEDGLRMTDDPAFTTRPPMPLDGFDKSMLMRVREGRALC
ncbi:MAG: glycosyltransferase [Bryobacteraceae bacterium]|jgi:GT2 family glycosyltransferase